MLEEPAPLRERCGNFWIPRPSSAKPREVSGISCVGRRRNFTPHRRGYGTFPSRTSRTLRASASGVKGFWRNATPDSTIPWRITASSLGSAHSKGVRDRSPRLSPLPRRDAGGCIHHRGPRHPPHPRPSWRLGSPRYPGPRSASRRRRGSRFTLSLLNDASTTAKAAGSRPVPATARRAEIRLMLSE